MLLVGMFTGMGVTALMTVATLTVVTQEWITSALNAFFSILVFASVLGLEWCPGLER